MKEKVAIYAGSFDPLSLGHLAIIHQASLIFDRLRVVVGIHPGKKPFFTTEERLEIIRRETADISGVSVDSTGNILALYAREVGASFLVRGLRNAEDFQYEQMMADANRKVAKEMITIFLPAPAEYSEISSTEIRRIISNAGDLTGLAPGSVAAILAERSRGD